MEQIIQNDENDGAQTMVILKYFLYVNTCTCRLEEYCTFTRGQFGEPFFIFAGAFKILLIFQI